MVPGLAKLKAEKGTPTCMELRKADVDPKCRKSGVAGNELKQARLCETVSTSD